MTPQNDSVATSGETTVTAAAVVRGEEADVGEPEEEPGREERLRPAQVEPRRPSTEDEHDAASRGKGRGGGEGRVDLRVDREPGTKLSRTAKTMVAASAKSSPIRFDVLGAAALADEQDPADNDQQRARENAGDEVSSRKTSAIATEKSGAVPTTTDVLEGPASRTAKVNRSCERPGPSTPASRKGQTCRQFRTRRGRR